MKNLHLLPEELRARVSKYRWRCACGQTQNAVSITRKGTIQGRCFRCGVTLFWNDIHRFNLLQAFCTHLLVVKKTVRGGGTAWCWICRIRMFFGLRTIDIQTGTTPWPGGVDWALRDSTILNWPVGLNDDPIP